MNTQTFASSGASPSGRALYLGAELPWAVSLDDGVALRVQAPGRARSLYPLRRLARIHSASSVQWTTDALLACLTAGVPIVFHRPDGSACGWCFGPRRRESTLAELLREAISQADWPDFWRAWLTQVAQREARALRRSAGLHLPGASNVEQLHVQLCNRLYQRWRCAPARHVRAVHRALRTLAAQVCAELVGDPTLLLHAAPGLNLPDAVAQLERCRADLMLLRLPPSIITHASEPAKLAAHLMERDHDELYRGCAGVLGDLEQSLRTWLQ